MHLYVKVKEVLYTNSFQNTRKSIVGIVHCIKKGFEVVSHMVMDLK